MEACEQQSTADALPPGGLTDAERTEHPEAGAVVTGETQNCAVIYCDVARDRAIAECYIALARPLDSKFRPNPVDYLLFFIGQGAPQLDAAARPVP